jgi:hypothetical protein
VPHPALKAGELRLFCIPALNFEPLWVSYEGKDESNDTLVPIYNRSGSWLKTSGRD